MSRKKGRPAFRGKKTITSVYLTPRTAMAMKAKSKAINYSVSDLMECCWYMVGGNLTRDLLDRFATRTPDVPAN